MSISITIDAPTAADARAQMQELLGGPRRIDTEALAAAIAAPYGEPIVKNDAGQTATKGDLLDSEYARDVMQIAPARERGKASPGFTRRTKAQIAEDEAADAAEATARVAAIKADVQADAAAQDAPEDNAETVAQDEADEASETEAAKAAEQKLTHDDVRNALGAYVKLYGMGAAQEDGPKVIALALKNPEIVKVSAIPETQEALGAVVMGVKEMTSVNPFKRAKVA